jgi:hypothetical protein
MRHQVNGGAWISPKHFVPLLLMAMTAGAGDRLDPGTNFLPEVEGVVPIPKAQSAGCDHCSCYFTIVPRRDGCLISEFRTTDVVRTHDHGRTTSFSSDRDGERLVALGNDFTLCGVAFSCKPRVNAPQHPVDAVDCHGKSVVPIRGADGGTSRFVFLWDAGIAPCLPGTGG